MTKEQFTKAADLFPRKEFLEKALEQLTNSFPLNSDFGWGYPGITARIEIEIDGQRTYHSISTQEMYEKILDLLIQETEKELKGIDAELAAI